MEMQQELNLLNTSFLLWVARLQVQDPPRYRVGTMVLFPSLPLPTEPKNLPLL